MDQVRQRRTTSAALELVGRRRQLPGYPARPVLSGPCGATGAERYDAHGDPDEDRGPPGIPRHAAQHRRIPSTHVGSLIRPTPLLRSSRARQSGQPYDEPAYGACLASVASPKWCARRPQPASTSPATANSARAISWSQYALERLSGFERRPATPRRETPSLAAPTAPLRRVLCRARSRATARPRPPAVDSRRGVRRRRSATPVRPKCSAISPTSRRRSRRAGVAKGFLPVAAPASVIPDKRNEYYKRRRDDARGHRPCHARRISRHRRRGAAIAARRCARRGHLRPHGAAGDFADYRSWVELQVDPEYGTRRHPRRSAFATTSAGAATWAAKSLMGPWRCLADFCIRSCREPSRRDEADLHV